ncbi:MAG: hypothetical protein OXC00_00775 [Acidimicrobiaceae bacterium]|nr:hypothetical protein [Acidimicrobiaceae bacterium]
MTSSPTRIRERLKRAINGRLPERYRRDDSGLTTLEWLLIVAAVAGLAALAVVLVTNVVGDTSEQIAGSSARRTAAEFAAAEVVADAVATVQPRSVSNWAQWETFYTTKCNRLSITYSDINPRLNILPTFDDGTTTAWPPAGVRTEDDVRAAAPAAGTARAHCQVT